MQKRKKIALSIVVVFLIPALLLGNQIVENREIQYVKDQIAQDSFDEWQIKSLTTQGARDFAAQALQEYEVMKEAYPEPKITILNEHEVREETYTYGEEEKVRTVYVLRKTDSEPDFKVEIQAEYTDTITFNDPYTANGQEAASDGNGLFSFTVTLDTQEESVNLTVENKYKFDFIDLLIIREENQHEADLQALIDSTNQKWEQSEAGQLCAQYPEWSDYDCEKLVDNKIWIGMTLDMLKHFRGNPSSTNVSNYGTGNSYQYCWYNYSPMCFYDEDGDEAMDSYN